MILTEGWYEVSLYFISEPSTEFGLEINAQTQGESQSLINQDRSPSAFEVQEQPTNKKSRKPSSKKAEELAMSKRAKPSSSK